MEGFWNMTVKSSQIRMKYAPADFLVDLGFMALTTSYDRRTRMLKKGAYPCILFSKKRQAMCPIFGFVQFPFRPSIRGDLVKLCVYFPGSLIDEATSSTLCL